MDGLFLTIANELAQLKTDHPFDQPAGTQVVMRWKPDPKLGYPQWYRRDVMGTPLSIAIDVVKFVPHGARPGKIERPPPQFAAASNSTHVIGQPMPVNTAKVEGRRTVELLITPGCAGRRRAARAVHVTSLGNWSPGQIYRHLAKAYNGSIDGFEGMFPWYIRAMAGLFKKKLIAGVMPPGVKLPVEFAKNVIPEPTSTEEGLAELRAAITRLEHEPHRAKNPVFGDLTKEEWNQLHLNHAKLHLSFLVPE